MATEQPTVTVADADLASTALVVGPDDHLVITYAKDRLTAEQAERLRENISERWPAIADRIMIVSGAESVAVVRGIETVHGGDLL